MAAGERKGILVLAVAVLAVVALAIIQPRCSGRDSFPDKPHITTDTIGSSSAQPEVIDKAKEKKSKKRGRKKKSSRSRSSVNHSKSSKSDYGVLDDTIPLP